MAHEEEEDPGFHIYRKGTSAVGLHFVAFRAGYYARGWTSKLEMVEGGPKEFRVLFGNQMVAYTNDGTITRKNFTTQALANLDAMSPLDSVEQYLPDDVKSTLFNTCPIQDIYIDSTCMDKDPEKVGTVEENDVVVLTNPTPRQNYYMEQTWYQIMKQKAETVGQSDLDFQPLPCLRIYNLLDGDVTANIMETVPIVVR
jgi:hypothetical protein